MAYRSALWGLEKKTQVVWPLNEWLIALPYFQSIVRLVSVQYCPFLLFWCGIGVSFVKTSEHLFLCSYELRGTRSNTARIYICSFFYHYACFKFFPNSNNRRYCQFRSSLTTSIEPAARKTACWAYMAEPYECRGT